MIATIEGDRERAVRHSAEELELIANFAIAAATGKARLARELCYLGRFDEAERLLEARTDNVWWQGYTHQDLAIVLEQAGKIDEAREELDRSLTIWERKGCLPLADRIRAEIESLGRTAV
jgi:tetratricopeptide (TPR) repeat protein